MSTTIDQYQLFIIFRRLAYIHTTHFISKYNLICKHCFRYRQKLSIQHALITLIDNITKSQQQGRMKLHENRVQYTQLQYSKYSKWSRPGLYTLPSTTHFICKWFLQSVNQVVFYCACWWYWYMLIRKKKYLR